MNCRDIEPLLLAERDGVLTVNQHAALDRHVSTCPACRTSRALYGEVATFIKTDAANVTIPDVDEEWRSIQAQLRSEAVQPAEKRRLAPVIWFGAPLAAAAALAIAFFVSRPTPPAVTPESAAAATIAYVDQESGWLVVWAAEGDAKGSG